MARKTAHQAKFSRIARMCQAQVGKGGGKARAKRVGACMRAAFKK